MSAASHSRGAASLARRLLPAASGAIFAAGLVLAGMTKPEKVIAFLDVGGRWDPGLAFVMVGAIAVHAVLYRVIKRRSAPLFDAKFHTPTNTKVDGKLVAGAALFGVGWGLAGYCPGPGLAALTSAPAAVFVAAMAVGFLAHRWMFAAPRVSTPAAAPATIDSARA
jgi:uncharacterized membrane protein YedE/YeeE